MDDTIFFTFERSELMNIFKRTCSFSQIIQNISMKRILLLPFLCLFPMLLSAQQPYLGDALRAKLHSVSSGKSMHRILVVMNEQMDIENFEQRAVQESWTLEERRHRLIRELLSIAETQQRPIQEFLLVYEKNHPGRVGRVERYWGVNMMVVEAAPDLIWQLAGRADIRFMDLDDAYLTQPIQPLPGKGKLRLAGSAEAGLKAIHLDRLWKMGYTGKNRIAYSIDTGIWSSHPTLRRRFLANFFPMARAWFPYDAPLPADKTSSHGTHTLGTAIGLDPDTHDTIGGAFNAYWMASDPVATSISTVKPLSDFMYAFEFALNPDGDTATVNDIPDIINNSWGYEVATDTLLCESYASQMFMVITAAGIANIFSAGNEGPGVSTISIPHHINTSITNSFTVGAVDPHTAGFPIASFSSRGPSICGGSGSILIKPEVSAPGVNTRSAVGTDGYDTYSGTSMASPHVSAAVLLLKEAFPYLTGNDILLALYYTAVDLGDPGEDNTYGMGIIDAEAAFNYLSGTHTPVPPDSNGFDAEIREITVPGSAYYCDTLLQPQLVLHNNGTQDITQGRFHYHLAGMPELLYNWSGLLSGGSSTTITLPGFNLPVMKSAELSIWFETDTSRHETSVINNRCMARFNSRPQQSIPFMEDFEHGIDSLQWGVENQDFLLTWDTAYAGGQTYSQHSAVLHFGDISPKQKDGLVSPAFDLSTLDSAFLKFDIAYQCLHAVYSDTLAVWLSTDCGATFNTLLYKKGGTTLQTYDTVTPDFTPWKPGQWRTETIDLSAYTGYPEVLIRFTGISRKGNNLYLDNIRVYSDEEPLGRPLGEKDDLRLWPNPATNELFAGPLGENEKRVRVEILDLHGRVVSSRSMIPSVDRILHTPVQSLPQGLYFLRITGQETAKTYRFIKTN